MTEDENQRMPGKTPRFTYRLGETVRIKSGVFASFIGEIEGINQAKSLLKVRVNIFGRTRPVKLRFLDVEKVTL